MGERQYYQTRRWPTREVRVGAVGIGGDNPIRIQSMTTSNTRDVAATTEQIIRLADAGCDIARVTVQGMKEADACEGIKNSLVQKGYTIPLVADIHFYPPAAMRVAEFADKVRINPGNFVDKRAQFKVIEYDDTTYQAEIERLEEKFSPLVEKCKKLKRALRIGTNHGSLSDRIMNRYGDSPAGMVESALEFTRVCRKLDFHDIIFSMKASNTKVMIEAYRLLVAEMTQLGWDYPLHLGVTEAGEGEDGRVKSAIGTGTLLLDGIGDTIRVSLTEDPWAEIDPCQRLVVLAESTQESGPPISARDANVLPPLHRDGSVIVHVDQESSASNFYQTLRYEKQLGRAVRSEASVDAVIANRPIAGIVTFQEPCLVTQEDFEKAFSADVIFFAPTERYTYHARRFFAFLKEREVKTPVILHFAYDCSLEDLSIRAAAEMGSLLSDGLGEGVCLVGDYPLETRVSLSFAILQGARMRTTKTEFISCPGCGRTLFDLQEVAGRIRERTSHLPGVKIAIMGCIVNGPGEMADADFGYVGSKAGMIDLYVGKECVQRNIPMNEADDHLITLIKSHGRWIEKKGNPKCVMPV